MSLRAKSPIAFSTCLLRSHVNLAPFWTNILWNKYSFEQIFFWTNALLKKCSTEQILYFHYVQQSCIKQWFSCMVVECLTSLIFQKKKKMYFSLKNSPRSELITESLTQPLANLLWNDKKWSWSWFFIEQCSITIRTKLKVAQIKELRAMAIVAPLKANIAIKNAKHIW